MKKLQKIFVVSLILPFCGILAREHSIQQGYNLIMGAIQFPKTLTTPPSIRIYCSGRIVKTEIDQESKRLCYSIPKSRYQKSFPVIICSDISFDIAQNPLCDEAHNTVAGLKIKPGVSYKCYNVTLEEPSHSDEQEKQDAPAPQQWHIEQVSLEQYAGRIPDSAIIVRYHPEYIEHLAGGNSFELPVIMVKENVVQACGGSVTNFYEESDKLLLQSIDTDTIHTVIENKVREHEGRLLVAPAA